MSTALRAFKKSRVPCLGYRSFLSNAVTGIPTIKHDDSDNNNDENNILDLRFRVSGLLRASG